MKNSLLQNTILTISFLTFVSYFQVNAQSHALIGYWQNWQDVNAPYISLDQIDSRYDIIEVSFAESTSSSDMTMVFNPDVDTQEEFIAKIQTLQNQGKKVLISIGGATSTIDLTSTPNKNAFISSVTNIIETYGFDGIDIDGEHGSSIEVTGGTITSPTDIAVINLIDAIKQIMTNYRSTHSTKLMLTMAPETTGIPGGQSDYNGMLGGYLPLVEALKDSIDILQVQLYNSGSMYGIDGGEYFEGTADFVVAMTEAAIVGFNTNGGMYNGLPANKVAVALPACDMASSGYINPTTLESAMNYLLGTGPQPGTYVLSNLSGYPNLKGLMTWSINWDAVANCGAVYEFAATYETIFGSLNSIETITNTENKIEIYPNPASDVIQISASDISRMSIYNNLGELVYLKDHFNKEIDISFLCKGIYSIEIDGNRTKLVKQ